MESLCLSNFQISGLWDSSVHAGSVNTCEYCMVRLLSVVFTLVAERVFYFVLLCSRFRLSSIVYSFLSRTINEHSLLLDLQKFLL